MLLYGLLWLQKSMNFIKTGLPPDFSLGNLTNQDQSNFCLPVQYAFTRPRWYRHWDEAPARSCSWNRPRPGRHNRAPPQRQRAGEGHNSSLGSAVIGEIFVPLIGGDGGGIDDRGPSFQMRQRRLDQVEKRVHVVLKYQGELLPRDIQDAPPDELDGVVVHQNIQRAETLHCLLHTAFSKRRVLQIPCSSRHSPPSWPAHAAVSWASRSSS